MIKSRIEPQLGRQRSLLERQAAFARDQIRNSGPLKTSERRQLAENLHGVVQIACTSSGQKVTRSAIAAEAGMADARGRSGRLHDYVLDRELPEEERLERARRRLIKKPNGYLRIAEAAAKLSGLDIDRAVVDLVQGTRLAEGMDSLAEGVEPEHFVMLADAIQGEARRIIELIPLAWYFRTIDEQGLSPISDGWGADEQSFLWIHRAVPWIDLFTEAVFSSDGIWLPKQPDGARGENRTMAVAVCRRVGLAVAPFGLGKSVRAFFVRRQVLAITPLSSRRRPQTTEEFLSFDLSSPILTEMPDPEGIVRSRWGTLRVHKELRETALCPVSDYPGDDLEFIEVTPSNIAAVLETGLPQVYDVDSDALAHPAVAYTKSPPSSRSALLERALLHGRDLDDPDTRLMTRLAQTAKSDVDGLRAWVEGRLASIEHEMIRMASGKPPSA